MANFKMHLTIASGASSVAAVTLYSKGFVDLYSIPWFVFLGSVGGLLPDIDSDNSRILKLFFITLGILASAMTVLACKDSYTFQFLSIIASIVFLMIRFPILALFKRQTVHRGVFHSVLSAVFFVLLTVYVIHSFYRQSISFSWISGIFVGFGFVVHLLLDECYSVDLSNAKLKRSFGTAFKLFSLRYLCASFSMFFACVLLYFYTPAFPFQRKETLAMINSVFDAGANYVGYPFHF